MKAAFAVCRGLSCVIPTKVGIQKKYWIPAYAGMTDKNLSFFDAFQLAGK